MTQSRIMIVEDERITAEDIHDILVQLGYAVTAVVSSGAEAIREAGRTNPDLVIMDIRIKGDIDGTEAAGIIREKFDIPVVYLTAHADRATLERAKRAEPLGYLVKPFQEHTLQATIEMALHKHRAERVLKENQSLSVATIRSLGEAVILTGQDGAVKLMNPAAESRTGWVPQLNANTHIDEVLQVQGPVRMSAYVRKAITSGTLIELERNTVLIPHRGEQRRIGGTVSPVRDHKGDIIGALAVFGDEAKDQEPQVTALPMKESAGAPIAIVGKSEEIQRLMHFARRVAGSEVSTILLTGESGTGKDVFAKYLHHHSRRASQPLLTINCAAIPETLMESELFGYEKGAFTDARQQKKGILELATGGTVFLDEIGEMPIAVQAKMLRVLEDQIIRRLGGTADMRIDVRVIAATNRDLKQAIEEGRFRLDLYYRLNVIQLELPALRDHRDDIMPLTNHFIDSYNAKFKRNIRGLAPDAASLVITYGWPGNVRELRNAIERAMVLEESLWLTVASLALDGEIPETKTMAAAAAKSDADVAPVGSLEEAERRMVLSALQTTGWNQTRAAELLSVTRDTLRYKMKKFNLRPD